MLALDDSDEDLIVSIGKGCAYEKWREVEAKMRHQAHHTQALFHQRIIDADLNKPKSFDEGGSLPLLNNIGPALMSDSS